MQQELSLCQASINMVCGSLLGNHQELGFPPALQQIPAHTPSKQGS